MELIIYQGQTSKVSMDDHITRHTHNRRCRNCTFPRISCLSKLLFILSKAHLNKALSTTLVLDFLLMWSKFRLNSDSKECTYCRRFCLNNQKEHLQSAKYKIFTFHLTVTVGRFKELNQIALQSSRAHIKIFGCLEVNIMKTGGGWSSKVPDVAFRRVTRSRNTDFGTRQLHGVPLLPSSFKGQTQGLRIICLYPFFRRWQDSFYFTLSYQRLKVCAQTLSIKVKE